MSEDQMDDDQIDDLLDDLTSWQLGLTECVWYACDHESYLEMDRSYDFGTRNHWHGRTKKT